MKFAECTFMLLLTMFFACGCASTKTETAPEPKAAVSGFANEELAVIVEQGKNLGNQLLAALKSNDFSKTANLPIGDSRNQLTEERFDKMVKKLQSNGGIYEFAYLGDMNMKPYRRLLWRVSFDPKGKAAGLDMIFEIAVAKLDGKFKAVGFGFRH